MCFANMSLCDVSRGINLPEGFSAGSMERLSSAIYHCSLSGDNSYVSFKKEKNERKKEKKSTIDEKSGRSISRCVIRREYRKKFQM